ncbi:transcription initiation factor TFIID subunit 3 [Sparganum proliferum]
MTAELLKTSFTEIVATVCFQVGFERASFEAIDILTDVLHKYLRTLSGFIAALGEDNYFGILDGVTTLEVLDQPLESLLTFADEVGSYMPRPVPTKCLPLYGHDKLRLPPKEQYALTALQLSHLPSAAVTEEKPAVKTPPKPTDLTLPNSALKGTCQQNLPPWAARVSYRLTRVTYDTVTKRLSEHEPPTPIAIDPSSLIHRRSMRPSTSTFRRSAVATVTPKVGSPILGAPSPRRAYNSKDAWAAALQAMPSPGAPSVHPQSPRVNSPSTVEKILPQSSSQVPTPKSSLLTPATKLASSRSAVKRAFRSRKRRPSFGRKRPPSSKRFALSSAWTSGPSSVPPVPEEKEEPVAVKVGESDDVMSGLKHDSRTPAASCHSSSPENYHQTFGFSPDSSPSDPIYHEEIFHRKEDDNSQPAETTVTPKLPSNSPPLPAGVADKSPVTSPARPFSPDLSAADRAPSTPHTPTTTPNNAEDRPKLSPPALSSSSSPPRHQRSETAATPATETKQRSTRATESGTSSVSEQTKTVGGHRPVQIKSSKKKNKKAPFSLPLRGAVTPKRRLPGSKTSIVVNKEPLSPLSENDLHSTPSPSACSDSNTEPMTDQERSADFEMPRQKPEPPLCSPERHASPELAKTDRTSSSYQSVPQPPSQATFLSSSGSTQPTVLHFPPTKRPRSRTSSSLSSLSSHSSSSSSPSSGSSSVLSSPLPASPGRGIGTKPVPQLPPGPPPLSSLTCLPQTPAAVCLGPTPGPPPPCTLSPITNPRALGSNAPSLAESDDGAKTPPTKQTSPPSSPTARTLSSVSQRGPPSPLSISSLPEPDSRFPRFVGTTTGTAAPLTPASTQPHGSLRIKIRLGADAASCHSSDGPPTETTDMLSRSSVSPFAALRPEAASPLSSSTSSTSSSSSSSSSSPSSSASRHSSDEDLDHVARRHAAIPPSLQVIRRRSPPIPSSQHESLTSQSSSVVPPVTKAPKLVIRFGNSESNLSIVRSLSPPKPPSVAESATSESTSAQQPQPPVLPPLHLSLSSHQPFSHHRRGPDRLRGSSISSLSASSSSSSSPSSSSPSTSSGTTSGLNSSDGVHRLATGPRQPPILPPPSLDRLPTRQDLSTSLRGGGGGDEQPLPPPPQLEACATAAAASAEPLHDLGQSSALPSLPPLLPLLQSSSTTAAPGTKPGDEPRSPTTRSHSRHSSKHRRSSRHKASTSHKSQKELPAAASGGRTSLSPLPPPPVLDVIPPPTSSLSTSTAGNFQRPTGRRARVDSVFTDDDDDEMAEEEEEKEDEFESKTFGQTKPARSVSSSLSSSKKHATSRKASTTDASPASSRSTDRGRSKKSTLPPSPSRPPQQTVSNASTTQVMSSSAGTSYYFNNNGEQIWLCPICLSEDDGNLMVGCDSCDDWYHSGCLGLAKEPDAAQWFCPKCSGEPLPPPQPRPPTAALPASSPTHAPASPHHHHHHHHHSSGTRKPKAPNTGTGTGSKRAKSAASARKRGLL